MTLTAEQAHKVVRDAAEKPNIETREVRSMKICEAIRQGDIYVTRLGKLPEHGNELAARQLAPGASRGSRHCAEGEVKIYAPPAGATPLTGPFIVATEGFRITHPEHAHFEMPAGVYQVTYQRDFAREELARVND